jgi:hypothetical protein
MTRNEDIARRTTRIDGNSSVLEKYNSRKILRTGKMKQSKKEKLLNL